MTKLEVFDPAMCCSSGVCGPDVDPALVAFAADLNWLASQGVEVRRYNLGQEAQAFAANPAVVKAMETGVECLPILVADGKVISSGVYLTRDQLGRKFGLAEAPRKTSCCTPGSGCC